MPASYSDILQRELGGVAMITSVARTGDTVRDLLFQPVQPAPQNGIAILWVGTNDLNRGEDGQTVFLNLVAKAEAMKNQGWRVFVLTSIQRQARLDDAIKDAERLKFNTLIRKAPIDKAPWQQVIDVAAMPEFSDLDNTVTGNQDVYAPDGVHLSGGGRLIAKQVRRGLKL